MCYKFRFALPAETALSSPGCAVIKALSGINRHLHGKAKNTVYAKPPNDKWVCGSFCGMAMIPNNESRFAISEEFREKYCDDMYNEIVRAALKSGG